jgi:ankyrin repeat protein
MLRWISVLCTFFVLSSILWAGPIHDAARTGDVEAVRKLLDADKNLLESDDGNGSRPLNLAAYAGKLEVCRLLIERGAAINCLDREGNPPIAQAASAGRFDVIKLLIEKGASVDIVDQVGNTPVQWAALSGSIESIKILVEHGAKIAVQNKGGYTPLHQAALKGHLGMVKWLLGSDKSLLESVDGNGWTALHMAAYDGHVDTCKFLISRGANVNHTDKAGNTPMARAATQGHSAVIELLLAKGVDPNAVTQDNNTALHWAAGAGHLVAVKALVKAGAKLDVQNGGGRTPLHLATYNGHVEVVKFLLSMKCNVNAKAGFDVTPLHWAEERNNVEIVKLLLAAGADTECQRTEEGNKITPLIHAARYDQLDCVKVLLAAKANANAQDKFGNRAIHLAAGHGNAAMVRELIGKGADPNAANTDKWTPLHFATAQAEDHIDAVKALVEGGASVDPRHKEGNTPLTHAALHNHLGQVVYLISKGANVNSKGDINGWWQDNNAETVLHFAVRSNNPKIVETLLDAKANPLVKDGFGDDAIAYAIKKGQNEMAKTMAKKAGVSLPDLASRPGKWHLNAGDNAIVETTTGIHVWQKATQDTDKPSQGTLSIPFDSRAQSWSIEFAIRFGKLQSVGAFVELTDGKKPFFFLGADGIYGGMGADLSGKRVWNRKGDGDWHTVKLSATRNNLEVSIDGNPVGTVSTGRIPTQLTFGSRTTAKGKQTEAWLRLDTLSCSLNALNDVASINNGGQAGPMSHAKAILSASGVDTTVSAPVQVVDGARQRVSARTSTIQANPLAVVEFAPNVKLPDFTPTEFCLVVNGKEVKRLYADGLKAPVFSVETPEKVGTPTRIKVIAIDSKKQQMEAIRATVYTADTALQKATKLELAGDKIVLSNLPEDAKSVLVFGESEFIGQLLDLKTFAVDARRIPVGQHEFFVVAQNAAGDYLPPTRSLIEIKPRYRITSSLSEGVFKVEGRETSMPWTIAYEPGVSIAKTRIYLRGTLIAESDKPSFEIKVPLSDVPSGEAEMQVIGISASGALFAPEACRFKVSNPYNDSFVARDARAKKLQDMFREMSYYDQKVAYWYAKAINEPAFRTYSSGKSYYTVDEFGREASVGYVDSFTVPGNAEEYLANCKAAIMERAGFRLEIGKLQKALLLTEQAKSTFRQVAFEAGEGSGLGLAALQEMNGL